MSGDEGSLFDDLGIPRESFLPEPPEDVWSAALAHALDPDSTEVDDTLVPQMDDIVHPGDDMDDVGLLGVDDTEDADISAIHPDLGHFGDVDALHDTDDDSDGSDDIDLGDGM